MELTNKVTEKRTMLEVIEKVMETLENEAKYVSQDYRVVGKEEEQGKNWRTGELLWEDEEQTIPKYLDKWGYVTKETLSDDDKAKLAAIEKIAAAIEKLI